MHLISRPEESLALAVDEPVADILARLQGLTAEEVLADAGGR